MNSRGSGDRVLDPSTHSRLLGLATADICDALMGLGVEPRVMDGGVRPLVPYSKLAGRAFTVRYEHEAVPLEGAPLVGSGIMDAIRAHRAAGRGSHWVMVSEVGDTTVGTIGDGLVSLGATVGISGFVSDGAARDSHDTRDAGIPIFVRGLSPRGPYNRLRVTAVDAVVTVGDVSVRPGDVIIADNDGVVVFDFDLCDEVVQNALDVRRSHANPALGSS